MSASCPGYLTYNPQTHRVSQFSQKIYTYFHWCLGEIEYLSSFLTVTINHSNVMIPKLCHHVKSQIFPSHMAVVTEVSKHYFFLLYISVCGRPTSITFNMFLRRTRHHSIHCFLVLVISIKSFIYNLFTFYSFKNCTLRRSYGLHAITTNKNKNSCGLWCLTGYHPLQWHPYWSKGSNMLLHMPRALGSVCSRWLKSTHWTKVNK